MMHKYSENLIPKSNKVQDKATNVNLNSEIGATPTQAACYSPEQSFFQYDL